jgi:hypothetical protein
MSDLAVVVRPESFDEAVFVRPVPVALDPPGVDLGTSWPSVPGATDVEVTAASVSIRAADIEVDVGAVTAASGNAVVVRFAVPARVRRLRLDGLTITAENVPQSIGGNIHLAVTADRPAPISFTVPPLPAQGASPRAFTGASWRDGVLTLPDVLVAELRIVAIDHGQDDRELATTVTGAGAVVVQPGPADATIRDGDGSVVWADAGPMDPSRAPSEVDLRVAVERGLRASLARAEPTLSAPLQLTARAPSSAVAFHRAARGTVTRRFRGARTVTVDGTATPLVLDGPGLAGELPASVTADVTINYGGLRIAPELSDDLAVPTTNGAAIGGVVVGDLAVTRLMAQSPLPPARVVLLGRATEPTELSVTVVEMKGARPGAALGPAAAMTLAPSHGVAAITIDLPSITASTSPLALSVRAGRGRFLWAARHHPLARVLVADPAPAPQTVLVGTTAIAHAGASPVVLRAASLPRDAFVSSPPLVACELAVTVELVDLTVRYAR